jgi:hypothetical protein
VHVQPESADVYRADHLHLVFTGAAHVAETKYWLWV